MNERQERFCFEYAGCLNATTAAIEAGYAPTSAYSQGFDLLKKPEIQSRITQLLDERRAEQQRQFINASQQAIHALLDVVNNPRCAAQARVSAAVAILDRGGHSVVNKSLIKGEITYAELTHEQRIERVTYLLEQARSRRIASDNPGDTGPD
ncbi:terminase small subunit [Acidithiobacillus sp.]|uniref:terminase small subunit n=1 Tax=Acidithiobacillus sp. TaxID=1872118 RepID=UPI002637193C|nr:terminase small subunit [Acidithiobacillus sp.]MDD2748594.1 terminase small subunit [Acidithiobacillus sp.]MDD5279879.1 terminase small subunit [Acidithiobacillus sp.]